jgi:hypothetical protein
MRTISFLILLLVSLSTSAQNLTLVKKWLGIDNQNISVVADWNGSTGTSQTANIQAAINSARDGETIKIPNGNYYVASTITITSRHNLKIEGGDSTVFYHPSGGTVFDVTTSNNVTFNNLSVHPTASNTSNDFFRITGGRNTTISNCRAYGHRLVFFQASGSTYNYNSLVYNCRANESGIDGITLQNCKNIRIERCSLYNNAGDGIKTNANSYLVDIQNCYFEGNDDDGFDCFGGGRDVAINNCEFVSQTNQIKNFGDNGIKGDVQNITISNNRFLNSSLTTISSYSPLLANRSTQTGDGSRDTFSIFHNLGYAYTWFDVYAFQSGTLIPLTVSAVSTSAFMATLSTAPSAGTFYILYYYKTPKPTGTSVDSLGFSDIASGATSFTKAHTFGLSTQIDVQYRLESDMTITNPANTITYNDNSLSIAFSPALPANVKVYIRERQCGLRGIRVENNDVVITNGGGWLSTLGGVQLICDNNFIRSNDGTPLDLRPLLTGSRISRNKLFCTQPSTGSTSWFLSFSTLPGSDYGVHQPDAFVEISENSVENTGRWLNNNANLIFSPILTRNRAIDLTNAIGLSGLTCDKNTSTMIDNVWISGSTVTKPGYAQLSATSPQIWTTGTRPTAASGSYLIGFNTTNSGLEFWNGSGWISLTTSN